MKPRTKVMAVVAGVATVALAVLGGAIANAALAPAADSLLSLKKPATASSSGGCCPVKNVNDGSTSTRWASTANIDPSWVYIDLGATYSIHRVQLTWDASCATAYQVQTSPDHATWTSIYSTTTGKGGVENLTGLTGTGRYVRMNGTHRCRRDASKGYSLREFAVYGSGGDTNPPTPPGTPTPSGSIAAPSAPATSPILAENWAGTSSSSFDFWPRAGSTVTSGVHDTGAVDGSALRLTLAAKPQPRPSGGAEVSSKSAVKYGTFELRAKTADCSAQPNAGVVTGLFTYANDGHDHDGDGITDNSEIDIEVLCAQPEVLWLTIWTDYVDGGAQRRVSRVVNVRTGQITDTCYHESFEDCHALSGTEAQPSTIAAHPSFNSATAYHEYGFTWNSTGVRYWVVLDGTPVILWDYRGPAQRVPSQPSQFLQNVWHTTDWTPPDHPGALQRPTAPVVACVDWTRVSR